MVRVVGADFLQMAVALQECERQFSLDGIWCPTRSYNTRILQVLRKYKGLHIPLREGAITISTKWSELNTTRRKHHLPSVFTPYDHDQERLGISTISDHNIFSWLPEVSPQKILVDSKKITGFTVSTRKVEVYMVEDCPEPLVAVATSEGFWLWFTKGLAPSDELDVGDFVWSTMKKQRRLLSGYNEVFLPILDMHVDIPLWFFTGLEAYDADSKLWRITKAQQSLSVIMKPSFVNKRFVRTELLAINSKEAEDMIIFTSPFYVWVSSSDFKETPFIALWVTE